MCHRKQEDIKKSGKSKVRASLIPEFLSSFSLYRRSFLTPYSQTDEDRRLKLCFSMGTIARLIILLDTTLIRKKGRKRSKNVEQNFPVSLVSIPVAAKEFLKFSLLTLQFTFKFSIPLNNGEEYVLCDLVFQFCLKKKR